MYWNFGCIVISTFLTCLNLCMAQGDTTDFFPVRVGNVWEYALEDGRDVWTAISDSIISPGRRLVWMRVERLYDGQPMKTGYQGYEIENADSVWTSFNEFPRFVRHEMPFRLRAEVRERWFITEGDTNILAQISKDTPQQYFGELRRARFIDRWSSVPDSLWQSTYVLVDGIGMYLSVFEPFELSVLVGARIGGIFYGRLTAVAEEGNRPTVEPLKVDIVHSGSQLELRVSSSQRLTCDVSIVNLAGEVVRTEPDQLMTAGEQFVMIIENIAPGYYLAVIEGDVNKCVKPIVIDR